MTNIDLKDALESFLSSDAIRNYKHISLGLLDTGTINMVDINTNHQVSCDHELNSYYNSIMTIAFAIKDNQITSNHDVNRMLISCAAYINNLLC